MQNQVILTPPPAGWRTLRNGPGGKEVRKGFWCPLQGPLDGRPVGFSDLFCMGRDISPRPVSTGERQAEISGG